MNVKLHCTGISISKPQNPTRIVLQYLIKIHIQFILHCDSKRTVCAQDSQQRTQMKYCAACHFHEHSLLEPHDKEQTEILCSMSLIHMKLTSILPTFYPQLNESINIPIQNKFFMQKNLEKTLINTTCKVLGTDSVNTLDGQILIQDKISCICYYRSTLKIRIPFDRPDFKYHHTNFTRNIPQTCMWGNVLGNSLI